MPTIKADKKDKRMMKDKRMTDVTNEDGKSKGEKVRRKEKKIHI